MKSILLLAAAVLATTTAAQAAGTVILEGSDAVGFHSTAGNGGAITYRDELWSAIGGASSLPILVVGPGTFGVIGTGTHAIVNASTLDDASVGALSQYVAIWLGAGGGCCNSNPGDYGTRAADLTAYKNAGGTIVINDYDGNSGWDFLTGGSSNSSHVAGVGGALGGPGCTDAETVTPTGTMNGFVTPPPIGCWTHQAYDRPYFAALGFTLNFFDSDPAFAAANPGFGPFSSLLSTGTTVSFVPEPGALALFGFGIVGLAAARRRAK